MTDVDRLIRDACPPAIELRHRLHQVPELLFEEIKTAEIIRGELARLGIKFTPGVEGAPTATIATLGDPAKPCIALRADIDGLPIAEMTGLPYQSLHAGRMHACGHDGHTATLLATAAVLKQTIADLPVCVKLIFQPAEEGGGGGDVLCQAGVLDGRIGPRVSAIFGQHGWPGLPVGTISTRPGPLLAATATFSATFVGKGCHGAFPHLGYDPIVAAAEAIVNLQQIASREYDPTDSIVVTVGIVHGGTATNVIPDRATIQGTLRTLSPEGYQRAKTAIERRCRGIAAAGGCEVEVEIEQGYPPTVNEPTMADYVAKIARQTLGTDRFVPAARPVMGGEDFAYYLRHVPGAFFFNGVQRAADGDDPPLHSDRYDFADDAVEVGVRMFLGLVSSALPATVGHSH